MLPFPRINEYGNSTIIVPKYQYTFSNSQAVSSGLLSGTISGGTYLTVPVSGYTTGIMGATLTLPSALVLGTADYSMQAQFYLNSTTAGYSVAFQLGSLTSIRFGDGGYGNRLQAASNFNSTSTAYSINQTRTNLFQTVNIAKWERKAGISKFYFNNVQTNFAVGTGNSYTNTQVADTASIGSTSAFTLGATNLALISFTLTY